MSPRFHNQDSTSKYKPGLSRRQFIGTGLLAGAAAAAGLAGCAPNGSGASKSVDAASSVGPLTGKPTEFTPSFMVPPDPVPQDQIIETIDVDVCVVGLGLAGVSALREAAAQGVKVIGLEKGSDLGYRSGEFGTIGSQFHKELGIEQPEPREVVSQLMKAMVNRPNAHLLNYWADHSGEDLDWYVSNSDYELCRSTDDSPSAPDAPCIFPMRCPVAENYDWRTARNPNAPGTFLLFPNHGWAMRDSLAAAEQDGAEARFNVAGKQLVVEDGKVKGVIASTEDGYIQVNAAKGVILTCGDLSGDDDMLAYYAPETHAYGRPYFNLDRMDDEPANTGDGHKMALWAGAVMEDGPYAHLSHASGNGAIGINPYLMVNRDGMRFMNEDAGGQDIENAIKRQKDLVAFQIFDNAWRDQLEAFPQVHGSVNHFVEAKDEAEMDTVIHIFVAGYTSDSYFQEGLDSGAILQADTLEELAELIEVPADQFAATVKRYNELVAQGKDEDYCKKPEYLFPVEKAPFFAVPFNDAGMLVLLGGIDCNEQCQALGPNKEPIEGLYVAGNTMGGRFFMDYPVLIGGMSHSMALTFGRLAAKCASQS